MKVLIATGGSGGHIFPAIETALELRQRSIDIHFAGSLDMASQRIADHGFPVHLVVAQGLLGRSPAHIFRFIVVMAMAIVKSIGIVRKVRPDAVVGFGGYGSFPIIFSAWLLRVPSMIHEQNVVPGKANALMAKLVSKVAISFKNSARFFGAHKVVWTGCPGNYHVPADEKINIVAKFGLDPKLKVVVLLGGSQGSKRLNDVFSDLVLTAGNELGIQAIHMTGKSEFQVYSHKYSKTPVPVVVKDFINNIEDVYKIADVVIARSGAATVSELGVLGIMSILVPYPFAGNHQMYNAKVLSDVGAGIIIEQKDLTVDGLKNALKYIISNDFSRDMVRQKTRGLFSAQAAEVLAEAIINHLGQSPRGMRL